MAFLGTGLLVLSVVLLGGSGFGYAKMWHNALSRCSTAPYPPGVVPYEEAVDSYQVTSVPMSLRCDYNLLDGGIVSVVTTDWPSTIAAFAGAVALLAALALLVAAAARRAWETRR